MPSDEPIQEPNPVPVESEPMIGDIPEAYFRAFVGKNADYYIARFRKFEEIKRDSGGSKAQNFLKRFEVNYAAIACNLYGVCGMYFLRKEYKYAFIIVAIKILQLFMYGTTGALIANIVYFGIIVFVSLYFNYLYYCHSRGEILRLCLDRSRTDVMNELNRRGGTSIISLIIYLICFQSFYIWLVLTFPPRGLD